MDNDNQVINIETRHGVRYWSYNYTFKTRQLNIHRYISCLGNLKYEFFYQNHCYSHNRVCMIGERRSNSILLILTQKRQHIHNCCVGHPVDRRQRWAPSLKLYTQLRVCISRYSVVKMSICIVGGSKRQTNYRNELVYSTSKRKRQQ